MTTPTLRLSARSPLFEKPLRHWLRRLNLRVFWAVALLGLGAGCTENSITHRKQLILVDTAQVEQESALAYRDVLSESQKAGALVPYSAPSARLVQISNRLVAQAVRYRPDAAQWAWSVALIHDPKTVNAWCMPGGKIAVYSGLLDAVKPTDDELAHVMGHEMAHALMSHGAENLSLQIVSGLGIELLTWALASDDAQARKIQQVSGVLTTVGVGLPNSRKAETEADRLGMQLVALAGYDPDAAVGLWKKMMKATGGAGRIDFLSTHPASEKRIEDLQAWEPKVVAMVAATPVVKTSPVRVLYANRPVLQP